MDHWNPNEKLCHFSRSIAWDDLDEADFPAAPWVHKTLLAVVFAGSVAGRIWDSLGYQWADLLWFIKLGTYWSMGYLKYQWEIKISRDIQRYLWLRSIIPYSFHLKAPKIWGPVVHWLPSEVLWGTRFEVQILSGQWSNQSVVPMCSDGLMGWNQRPGDLVHLWSVSWE